MLVPISAFLLCLVSDVARGEECAHFGIFEAVFVANFAKNLSAHIILVLDATFVPNLTFFGLLSPEISFAEKSPDTHQDTQLVLPSVNLSALNLILNRKY